ncbi:hypothetical protein [Prosthecobacter fluviatilis]|uniref:Uncharacterized protein n=1 Tax=Prosthecobacter fluviatilis TaxID=445931 RepID=A0ABW0KXD6_9BACT
MNTPRESRIPATFEEAFEARNTADKLKAQKAPLSPEQQQALGAGIRMMPVPAGGMKDATVAGYQILSGNGTGFHS